MKPIRLALLSALLCAGAVSLNAQAADPIKAGVFPSYPPLDMRDVSTNTLTGFDVDLGNALSKILNRPLDWKDTNFSELIAATKTGRIDIFFNGMFDTAARQEQVSFVDYLRSGTQFITLAASTAKTPEALCGKKIGMSRMTTAPAVLANWNTAVCAKAGQSPAVYVPAENSVDARMQLKQGRTDAVMMDSLTIPYVLAHETEKFVTVGEPLEYQVMGIGVSKDDKALQKDLAAALQKLIDDGTYAKLLQKWNLSASSALTKVTLNGTEAK